MECSCSKKFKLGTGWKACATTFLFPSLVSLRLGVQFFLAELRNRIITSDARLPLGDVTVFDVQAAGQVVGAEVGDAEEDVLAIDDPMISPIKPAV